MAKQIRPTPAPAANPAAAGSSGGQSPSGGIVSHTVTKVARKRGPRLTAEQHRRLIELTAYYLSERRGFEAGHEHEDWVIAEGIVIDRAGLPVT